MKLLPTYAKLNFKINFHSQWFTHLLTLGLTLFVASCTSTQAGSIHAGNSTYGAAKSAIGKKKIQAAGDQAKLIHPDSKGFAFLRDDMDRASLRKVLKNQFDVMQEADLTQKVYLGQWTLTLGQLRKNLQAFMDLIDENLPPREFSNRVQEEYVLHKAGKGKKKQFVITGYYTPVIEASMVQTEEYQYPLYRMPSDESNFRLVSQSHESAPATKPKTWKRYTREQIDRDGVLKGKGLEIAWLKDDLDRFFLHIQGSGTLKFRDGTTQGVQYISANSYTYKGIGKLMVRDGAIKLSQGSMQGIKHYLRNNPHDIPKYFFQNKRYIYFNFSDLDPLGSGGGELVAGRSIATDKSYYPAGALAFLKFRKPVLDSEGRIKRWIPTSRFVADQDTGNAIRGPGRADLYFGKGHLSGAQAGHFKERGEIYYLMKKDLLTSIR
jgi:membrane-bound lytic murein transglycosylase A